MTLPKYSYYKDLLISRINMHYQALDLIKYGEYNNGSYEPLDEEEKEQIRRRHVLSEEEIDTMTESLRTKSWEKGRSIPLCIVHAPDLDSEN